MGQNGTSAKDQLVDEKIDKMLATLKESLGKTEDTISDIQRLTDKLTGMQQQISETESALKSDLNFIRTELQTITSKSGELKAEFESIKTADSGLKAELEHVRKEKEALKAELEDVKKKNDPKELIGRLASAFGLSVSEGKDQKEKKETC